MSNNLLKKTRGAILCTGALSLSIFFSAFAGEARINFSDHDGVSVGSEVNVTMKITSDDGTNLSDADVMLSYPDDVLEFISGTDSDGGVGNIRVHGTSNGGGTTVLTYNLRFNTLSAGSASIEVSRYEVYDTGGDTVTINYTGNSAITVNAAAGASTDASLLRLNVSPGELSPSFNPDVTSYTVTVGSSVDSLVIDAPSSDSGARVEIQNNAGFQMGDNTVTITVTAADGVSSRVYNILVSKVEGGPEVTVNETSTTESDEGLTEGVSLYSRGRTITILSPDDSVEIPEGFRSGTIMIDNQRVPGWVPEGTDDPQYCLIYGMNEDGELNFYRYDMQEKSVQRYIEDPLSTESVSKEEYDLLQADYEDSQASSGIRLIIIVILATVIFVLAIFCAYLLARTRSLLKSGRLTHYQAGDKVKRQRSHPSPKRDAEDEASSIISPVDEDILENDHWMGSDHEADVSPGDDTLVIRRSRKRYRKKVPAYADESGPFVQDHEVSLHENEETALDMTSDTDEESLEISGTQDSKGNPDSE